MFGLKPCLQGRHGSTKSPDPCGAGALGDNEELSRFFYDEAEIFVVLSQVDVPLVIKGMSVCFLEEAGIVLLPSPRL